MKLAVVHHHLNRGGVAHVVLHHLRSLAEQPEPPKQVALVYGGRKDGWPDELPNPLGGVRWVEVVVPGLDYDEGLPPDPRPAALADALQAALGAHGFEPDQTVVHAHNPALGKNLSLPGALSALAERGYRLLLQAHDFAEDFRPANYRRQQRALAADKPARLPELLYPQAETIHYAVLNGRDLVALREAGVSAERLHLLPNPVPPLEAPAEREASRARLADRCGVGEGQQYVLYPVRGIRRKNVGEALLWAAAAPPGTVVGFTLPPQNPAERPSYDRWRWLAAELRLPCLFEVGSAEGLSLPENLAACDRVLTTSVAEGFGLVFLEAGLAHRPLVGRDLPEITTDFLREGMAFSGLRPRFDVPLAWLGRDELFDALARDFSAALDAYGRAPPARRILEQGFEEKLQHGCVDFGDLNAELQARVVRRVSGDGRAREMLHEQNPWLGRALSSQEAELRAEAEQNAAIARKVYSLEGCGRRLSEIYRSLAACVGGGPLDRLPHGGRILDAFLGFNRFRPVRL